MARSVVTEDRAWKEASYIMLHVGLDLSRKRVDVCLISDQGELVDELVAPFDQDGLGRCPIASPRSTSVGCARWWSR